MEVGVSSLCCPGILLEPIGETSSHATRQVNVCPRSSQLAEPLWTDPVLKNGTGMRELNLHLHFKKKKKKKAQAGSESSNYPTRALYARKKQPPPPKSPPTPAPLFAMRFVFSASTPIPHQWGTADAEVKVPSDGNQKGPFCWEPRTFKGSLLSLE